MGQGGTEVSCVLGSQVTGQTYERRPLLQHLPKPCPLGTYPMPDLWNLAVALNCPVQFLDTFDEKLEAPPYFPRWGLWQRTRLEWLGLGLDCCDLVAWL